MRQAFPVDLSLFSAPKPGHHQVSKITPQQTLATLRFLRAEVEPFKNVSEKVLLRLLKHDVIITLNHKDVERHPDKFAIYKRNKLADYFVLIIEVKIQYHFSFFLSFILASKIQCNIQNNTYYPGGSACMTNLDFPH